MTCLDRDETLAEMLGELINQYREAPNLQALISHHLGQLIDAADALCVIPEKHEIMSAVGEQLTNVGKRLGWPRCHCVCSEPGPVFAWDCTPVSPTRTFVGFCDETGSWGRCEDVGTADYCFNDDEVYRGYLLARRYQALQYYEIDSLQAAAQHIWGGGARANSMGAARVVVSPGRPLDTREIRELPLAFRVLPIAPGIAPYVDQSTKTPWGFGDGWAGLCEGGWACPELIDPYQC